MDTAIVWFRRDLRLQDNPALDAAVRSHDRVVCIYIFAPDEEKPWQPGAASRWWLHHSLIALSADLKKRGAKLHVLSGKSLPTLRHVIKSAKAGAVYWNRLYEPAIRARDKKIQDDLEKRGIEVNVSNAALLFEPWVPKTKQGGPFKVFTPFWRHVREQWQPRPPSRAPVKVLSKRIVGSVEIDDLKLLPTIPWDASFAKHWTPGEQGAQRRASAFLSRGLKDYTKGRDVPAENWTSSLSPHLHFGEIGPRQIAWRLHANQSVNAEFYLRELGWREFSHHLLHHFPQTPDRNLNPTFVKFPWARHNDKAMRRWQRGRTGIPIVDAGMRQLWTTGWMHNRVRMLVASFLTKNLRQHWLEGARWFWDTLVDADLANNTQGWQWTAGSGADAAPYFRIFNPVLQGKRFDRDGVYVKRWVPELKRVPARFIHAPWDDPKVSKRLTYPKPLVDLGESRAAALAAFKKMRNKSG
jgi:deoxyribodipyrimidine photo-lyase